MFSTRVPLGAAALVAGAVALAAAGCQSYKPAPLRLNEHRAAFLARGPESPQVAAFAARLCANDPPGHGAFDLTDGVHIGEAEAVAMVFNADLRAARLRAGVTRASAENAGLWEDPTIGVDLTRIIQNTPHPWKVFGSIGLTIPISGRLEIEKARAGLEHGAELARVAQSEWRVRMELRRAWARWSALEADLAARRDFVERADQILALVDRMERAGEMSRVESRLFRIEKAANEIELSLAVSRVDGSHLAIRQLMGISPTAAMRLIPVGLGVSDGERGAGIEAAIAHPGERNPAMRVAAAEYETAESTLKLEVRKQYPDLNLGPGYGREDGQDQVLLGLSVPIPILNANRRRIAEATAERELARANVEATLERLMAEKAAAEVHLRAAAAQRRAMEGQMVPLVDAQYADARRIAELGEVNALVLLDSLQIQRDTKTRLVAVRLNEALAAIDLDEIAGPTPNERTAPADVERTPTAETGEANR